MKNKNLIKYLIVFWGIIIIDQLIKILVLSKVEGRVGTFLIAIYPNINTGMALGLNAGNTKNIIITIVILALIGNFVIKQRNSIDNKTMYSLCLIAGGGLSNLLDRFLHGGVVDYIDAIGFPIFNLADILIIIGWVLLVIYIFRYSINEGNETIGEDEDTWGKDK